MASPHLYTLADQIEGQHENENEMEMEMEMGPETPSPCADATFSDEAATPPSPSPSPSHWTIGWMTPSAIVTCFLLAASLASMHLSLFHWLDQREVTRTIRQPYVTALSVVFVNGFRTFLAAALGLAFVQMLWQGLRVRPMRVGDLDAFLSVLANPLYLGQLQLLRVAPIPFLCALVCWCLPIAMVFPAGALTVEPQTLHVLANQSVPTFDPGFLGNGTFSGMMAQALWQPDDFDAYSGPTNQLTRLARQAIMAGRYLPAPSPCAGDCSYTIDLPGPSFECRNASTPQLARWVNQSYPQTRSWPALYLASADYGARTNRSQSAFDFALRWQADGGYENLRCRAYESIYTVHLTYTGGQPHTTSEVHPVRPLNSSYLYDDYGMYPQTGSPDARLNATATGATGGTVTEIYRRANLAAVQDSLVLALSGYIDIFLLHSQPSANTIIALSELYSGSVASPRFDLTGASLQDLLQNITLSLLTLNQTTVTTTVTSTVPVNVYSFQRPVRLIAPYFACLGVALGFLLGGTHALVRNGISASLTGLFQTLCTTRASARLDDLAAQGCLGGRENVPDELRELKVMFGEIRGKGGLRRAGLGVADEVMPLQRGSL
ncbi:hypothetical protein BO70DRAFT_423730 [Aspergillus heteromorphus CBS 117.55]|uniref:Uncharacterized protein n=1 Tax=Aspergillus heteromorphus CBS 117.55 TaxID=1448321 RepID=A0A317WKM2_9EURO|nr:uncharacterized protein BO70DRAFT_423730 [Aspergillus heteromorphus CBS 117.55]PWY84750.1 hypothetical protein BO70DRAFT_423730 [Aspergillus heteromorphus CBS 117.55]